ncbi:hypothetical protein MDUV_11400 [Mycolicibacterium duvalii]|uniref:Oxidoreductase n=1 Tax=Mycolicibacterium duvalii TaxID=39688 RepID=A0A7I7JWS2_9MYCO|nr:hypothetical protein MDUV_11400 [Mycolicibacterium duvalii]
MVVVTGGGGGIGAAIALELGRAGDYVVTVDPLVSLDGAQTLSSSEQTTADRIIAAGGAARASGVSVTDSPSVTALLTELAEEFGGLDAVVNVAGISRPTSYTAGADADWTAVLEVHLDGYRNVLCAALPLMAAAGRGHILGVTSGSGWRAADTGAYGCAKRAVAALTWQIGRQAPDGVTVNAISPIAATRMVAGALAAARKSTAATGGLALNTMPDPDEIGPLGAHLVDATFTACQGRVLFSAGSEAAVIDEPRLIEVVRANHLPYPARVLDAAIEKALVPAEKRQASSGGSNARFGRAFERVADEDPPPSAATTCAVCADSDAVAADIAAALRAREIAVTTVDEPAALSDIPTLDAVVVALADHPSMSNSAPQWRRILEEHDGIVAQIDADTAWARAVARLAMSTERHVRLVVVHDAATSGGRTRAQVSTQLSRAGHDATAGLVQHCCVSVETDYPPVDLIAHLVCSPHTGDLAGAELVAGPGWFGLRSHPHPTGSITYGGPQIPEWFDDALQEVVQPR